MPPPPASATCTSARWSRRRGHAPLIPHVGGRPDGADTRRAPTVLIGFMPAARMGDMAVCVGPPDSILKGSMTVLIGGQPAARMGDPTAHGGSITLGFPTVMIGDVGQGSTLSAAAQSGAPFCAKCGG